MTFLVTLDFKRGPSFTLEMNAASRTEAIERTKKEAVAYGFTDQVKKAKAVQR